MPDPKPIKVRLKEIAESVRMIIVYKLAILITKVAPNTRDGVVWVTAIHAAAEHELQEKGLLAK